MYELVVVLTLWLSATFDLPQTQELPRIRFEQPATLANIRYGGSGAAFGHDIVALYDGRSNSIVLGEGWDSADPADVSVLVHELVHHLQHLARIRYRCPEEREKLAYEAQARWLALFGRDLASEFRLDAMTMKLRTSCLLP